MKFAVTGSTGHFGQYAMRFFCSKQFPKMIVSWRWLGIRIRLSSFIQRELR